MPNVKELQLALELKEHRNHALSFGGRFIPLDLTTLGRYGIVRTSFELSNIVSSAFTSVLAKHSKSFDLFGRIWVGVDRMQRNFEPMRKQVENWQKSELTDVTAKVVI